MGLYETKSFFTAKEIVTRLKMQPTEWEKIYASYTFDKGLINQNLQGAQKTKLPKNP
jgi:abortive infection bacteriophage resistance protein